MLHPTYLKTIATTLVCATFLAALVFWADHLPAPVLEGMSSGITDVLIAACVTAMLAVIRK